MKSNRAAFRLPLYPRCVSVIYCSDFDSECVIHPKPLLLLNTLKLFILIRHNNYTQVNLIHKVTLYNQGTLCNFILTPFEYSPNRGWNKTPASRRNHFCMLCCSTSLRLNLAFSVFICPAELILDSLEIEEPSVHDNSNIGGSGWEEMGGSGLCHQ